MEKVIGSHGIWRAQKSMNPDDYVLKSDLRNLHNAGDVLCGVGVSVCLCDFNSGNKKEKNSDASSLSLKMCMCWQIWFMTPAKIILASNFERYI